MNESVYFMQRDIVFTVGEEDSTAFVNIKTMGLEVDVEGSLGEALLFLEAVRAGRYEKIFGVPLETGYTGSYGGKVYPMAWVTVGGSEARREYSEYSLAELYLVSLFTPSHCQGVAALHAMADKHGMTLGLPR